MKNQKTTQNKSETTTGFSGVLLALLANAIITIKTNEINYKPPHDLEYLFSLAILCLLINIILEFATTHYTPVPKYIMERSNFFFICGLIATAAIIIAILTETLYATIIFAVLLVIAIIITIKPKTN